MYLDSTTLSDLEVFVDSGGRGGLFTLIDTTATAVGRRALRGRLEAPFSTVEQILETQDAVRFLTAHPGLVRIDPRLVEPVQRYADSNLQLSRTTGQVGAFFEGLWFRARYRDLYREVREGVQQTGRLLAHATAVGRALTALDLPPVLDDLAHQLLAKGRDLPDLDGSSSTARVMQADSALRGDGLAALNGLIELLGELDALQSMADTTERLAWTLPTVVDSEHFLLEGEGIHHPFVENAVQNPIDLSGGEPMVFLTGPNMAGKTTYLRSAAICVLLAQTGMGVPARRLRLTPVEVLLTSLNPSDNLRAGLSFFLSEVLRVRAAAEVLADGRRAFVLFDEVFKGTNVRDALEASATVILGFAKALRSGFVFSSHLLELVDSLRSNPRVRFHYFDGQIVKGRAEYSYRMKPGVSDQRLGLHLLNEARIPDLLERIGYQGSTALLDLESEETGP